MVIIHAGCMLAGVLALAAGVTVAMTMRGKRWWLRLHRRFGSAGVLCMLLGSAAAILMVSLQTGQHFAVPHAWLGLAAVLSAVCTYLIGIAQVKKRAAWMRPLHRWAGRVTLALLVLNVLSGLSLVGIL